MPAYALKSRGEQKLLSSVCITVERQERNCYLLPLTHCLIPSLPPPFPSPALLTAHDVLDELLDHPVLLHLLVASNPLPHTSLAHLPLFIAHDVLDELLDHPVLLHLPVRIHRRRHGHDPLLLTPPRRSLGRHPLLPLRRVWPGACASASLCGRCFAGFCCA